MASRLPVALGLFLLVSLAGCGGDGGGNPASASPTVTGIRINGPSTIDVGQTVTFTATATLSNGSSRPATGGTWGTDAPAVVTINNNGQVAAQIAGLATIWVDAEGHRGTLLLTAVVNFTGTWRGQYQTTACVEDFIFFLLDFCQTLLSSNFQVTVAMTQTGNAVSGTLSFGTNQIPTSGSVDGSGTLRLNGSVTENDVRMTMLNWESRLQGSAMEGTFRQQWLELNTLQSATFDGRLLSLPKVSGGALPASFVPPLSGDSPVARALERLRR